MDKRMHADRHGSKWTRKSATQNSGAQSVLPGHTCRLAPRFTRSGGAKTPEGLSPLPSANRSLSDGHDLTKPMASDTPPAGCSAAEQPSHSICCEQDGRGCTHQHCRIRGARLRSRPPGQGAATPGLGNASEGRRKQNWAFQTYTVGYNCHERRLQDFTSFRFRR